VLFRSHGLDPEAARLLDKALSLEGGNPPLAESSTKIEASQAGGSCTRSFLGALLGPKLEAAALDAMQDGR